MTVGYNKIDLNNINDVNEKLRRLATPKLTKYIPYKPTPKQAAFLLMNSTKEILYGGAAGGGKSVAQLMAALQFVDIPGYSSILFRKTYADLTLPGALIDMSKEWLKPFVNSKEVKWSDKEKKYTFPSGATVNFGYLDAADDHLRYQGAEFQYIGVDEVTHIYPKSYRYMFSRLRKPVSLKVPLRMRATANPGGKYGQYYKTRFFDEGKEKGRIFIGAGIYDNPHLDVEEYIQSLDELDPVEREQLLHGNWEIKDQGDMFKRDWIPFIIGDESSIIPTHAKTVRFWDLASTDPKKRKGKNKREPDWTVGFKLSHANGLYWIRDIIREQKTPSEVEKLVKTAAIMDGYNVAIRMEQEPGSSGVNNTSHYARNVVPGYDFLGVTSTGSKAERARPVSAACQNGLVQISQRCRHVSEFFDEIEVFPYGLKDDMVDGFSGAFNYFKSTVINAAPTGVPKASGSYWRKI